MPYSNKLNEETVKSQKDLAFSTSKNSVISAKFLQKKKQM